MKLKFRAEKEDVLMFVVFAVFLLYIVAIGVLNLSSFAAEGYFYGLNPFPAFGPKYVVATLTFYFLALVGLFVSVSSYFFDREKGIGLVTQKKDKGYSRWSKDKEIQESKNVEKMSSTSPSSSVAGTPLIYKGNEIWVDNGENHTLVIGATGSGKTQSIVLPTVKVLAKKGESMVITDPKGEIYEKTSEMLRAKGYQILLLNFRDPQNGNSWNPMTLPYQMYQSGNQDKAVELLDDLALNILYDESNSNADPFWEKTSADYFSGLALGLFEDAKEEEININSISLMSTVGEEKFGGSTYIKEYFNGKDPAGAAAINAASTIMAPSETKGSILAVFKQKVKLFASRENLSEMLSHSDIDLKTIGERPTALFIVIQDEKKTYHSLVTILLKQVYETLISVAQSHGGKLPVRTNFLLDEFANMPPLKDVTTMITAARSRQIRFTMIIQNFAQLDQVYGKENAETLRGNCGNLIYLVTTELKALEEISKMCGEVKSKKDDKTASTPLVTVSDLQRMKENEVIILRLRMNPFKTKFIPDYKMDWGEKYPQAEYPTREKRPVHTFDLKEYVKEAKKKKLIEMMNNASPDGGAGAKPPFLPPNLLNPQGGTGQNTMSNAMPGQMPPMFNPFLKEETPKQQEPKAPTMNPFLETPKQPSQTQNPMSGFNVDEIMKKIDAKIAELEKEEAQNKAPAPPVTPSVRTPVVPNHPSSEKVERQPSQPTDTSSFLFPPKEETSFKSIPKQESLFSYPEDKPASITPQPYESNPMESKSISPVKEVVDAFVEPAIPKPVSSPTSPSATKPSMPTSSINPPSSFPSSKNIEVPEQKKPSISLDLDDEDEDDFFDDFFEN